MMARQTLPYVKIGNVVRFDLDECEAVVAGFNAGNLGRT